MLVALALLSLAVLTLCALLISGLQLSSQNRDSVAAAQGAQTILEQVRSREVALPAAATTFRGEANDPTLNGFPPAPYPVYQVGEYRILYTVRSEPVAGRPGLYWLGIEAHWGQQHRLDLEAYVFRP